MERFAVGGRTVPYAPPGSGIVKQKLLLPPGADSTQIRPPWRSTMRLLIARPIGWRPEPL